MKSAETLSSHWELAHDDSTVERIHDSNRFMETIGFSDTETLKEIRKTGTYPVPVTYRSYWLRR